MTNASITFPADARGVSQACRHLVMPMMVALNSTGVWVEHAGLTKPDFDEYGLDRPYVYFHSDNTALAFQVHQIVLRAMREGHHWRLIAFFAPESSLIVAPSWKVGELRYNLELLPRLPITSEHWASYRQEAIEFLINAFCRLVSSAWTERGVL